MPRRAARLGALAAAAVLSLSACGWSSPIRTQEMYAPSDGIRLDLAEDVRVENLMVLTGGNFADGWVLGSVANDRNTEVTVTVEVAGASEDVTVAPGTAEEVAFEVASLEEPAGAMTPATLVFEGTATRDVPVLDADLSPYDVAEPPR